MQNRIFTAIGLMSGTSCDGIDAALIKTDGKVIYEFGQSLYLEYDDKFKNKLKDTMEFAKSFENNYLLKESSQILNIEKELTKFHVKAVQELLKKSNLKPDDIDIIGFHGQTIIHKPQNRFTLQIGDAQMLSFETKISVIFNFRENDVKLGGQGAPMVPLYHEAITYSMIKPLVVVNIGGVSNITYLGKNNEIIAFDTGPGSAYIDDCMMTKFNKAYDTDGEYARSGKINSQALNQLMTLKFFSKKPPKSLDRNEFKQALDRLCRFNLSINDYLATLTAFTAKSIAISINQFAETPNKFIITGGGRKNKYMIELITKYAQAEITDIDNIDIKDLNGNDIEAQAFAYLAVRSKLNLPLTLPSTTGVNEPAKGGVFIPYNILLNNKNNYL